MILNIFIEHAATSQSISLRTGCMCNLGGTPALLGVQEDMEQLYPGVTLKSFEQIVGRNLGAVGISLGLGSNFGDVWKVVQFATTIGNERSRCALGQVDGWVGHMGLRGQCDGLVFSFLFFSSLCKGLGKHVQDGWIGARQHVSLEDSHHLL